MIVIGCHCGYGRPARPSETKIYAQRMQLPSHCGGTALRKFYGMTFVPHITGSFGIGDGEGHTRGERAFTLNRCSNHIASTSYGHAGSRSFVCHAYHDMCAYLVITGSYRPLRGRIVPHRILERQHYRARRRKRRLPEHPLAHRHTKYQINLHTICRRWNYVHLTIILSRSHVLRPIRHASPP